MRRSAAALVLVLALLGARTAGAEEVFTGQAAAANALDAPWIPAPARRAAVCIIDTGVDLTPDTTNVVARFATDGGSGDDRNADKHGTLMAMIASAPYNGFGMVGIAPSINVVSVRASRDGNYFGGDDLQAAMQICINWRDTYNIKVVSMSLGGDAAIGGVNANPYQRADLEDTVTAARRHGMNVVAAAGNDGGESVNWPASYEPVISIGASDYRGARCSFASWGKHVDLWAPGCPLDVARPDEAGKAARASGSSEATVLAAGVLAEMRGLMPSLPVDDAETMLWGSAKQQTAGRHLDADELLEAAGLLEELAAGHARLPSLSSVIPLSAGSTPSSALSTQTDDFPKVEAPSEPGHSGAVSIRAMLVKPRMGLCFVRRGKLVLRLRGRPRGVEAHITIYARARARTFPTASRLSLRGDNLRTQIFGTPTQMTIIYRDPARMRSNSESLVVRLASRHHAYRCACIAASCF